MAVLLGKPLNEEKKTVVPLVAIRDGVVFPHTEVALTFGRNKSVAAVEYAWKKDGLVCLVSQKDSRINNPAVEDLYSVGTLAKIDRFFPSEEVINALVKGLHRVKIGKVEKEEPFFLAQVAEFEEVIEDDDEIKALERYVSSIFKKVVNLGKNVDLMVVMRLMGGVGALELADQVSSVLEIPTVEKQGLLEMVSVKKRLEKLAIHLSHEKKVLELERSISSKTRDRFNKSMRESLLRERKKTIEKELGEMDEEEREIAELKEKIKKAKMPKEVAEKANKEVLRLARLSPQHPEVGYIRTYLDWLMDLPWAQSTPNQTSIARAAKILDEDHHGLKKIKERIVEYLAVMKLKNQKEKRLRKKGDGEAKEKIGGPTILCFVGPPGVGKTSIGKSIARSLKRKFVRMSLGGIRDEAEIRGHRRTYVGAMPGRIIQGIKDTGMNNPVFMLDEIDKVGADFRGDPSAALLEALDPEQNFAFSDHYLEVPFDLSKVLFITTANVLDTIPPALRDRMEVIPFPGYTEEEKFHIAQKYLWDKQLRFNGLGSGKLKLEEAAIYEIIRRYTREAGVRELERHLAKICRRLARRMAEKKIIPGVIKKETVKKYLGPQRFSETLAEKEDEVGIATGLAFTQAGGDIIFVEVALMPGKGRLLMTGKLGKVMKESGQAALSYVRSRWKMLGLKPNFYNNLDVHIHVPEGAVSKDGPSAGITITSALVSALTKKPIRRGVGMTGEITLRGRVLEIGGIKEKVIAAHRSGLRTVILPRDNKKDLEDIPVKVRKDIKFVFVDHMDEVTEVVLK